MRMIAALGMMGLLAGCAGPMGGPSPQGSGWGANPAPANARADDRRGIASEALASVRPDMVGGTAGRAALPPVSPDTPNIVAFALQTTHGVGQPRFNRPAISLQSHSRNCARFANADRAQEEFLRRGGPERDPLNLDPDGDGFACTWSPAPFRAAARAED